MNYYNTLMRYYHNTLEEQLDYIAVATRGKAYKVGFNCRDERAFKRKMTMLLCEHYNMKMVPTDWLRDLTDKTGLPKNWKDLVEIAIFELAADDFLISKVK